MKVFLLLVAVLCLASQGAQAAHGFARWKIIKKLGQSNAKIYLAHDMDNGNKEYVLKQSTQDATYFPGCAHQNMRTEVTKRAECVRTVYGLNTYPDDQHSRDRVSWEYYVASSYRGNAAVLQVEDFFWASEHEAIPLSNKLSKEEKKGLSTQEKTQAKATRAEEISAQKRQYAFIAMEKMDGHLEDLLRDIAKDPALSVVHAVRREKVLLKIERQMIAALETFHAGGFGHLDVKLANFFYRKKMDLVTNEAVPHEYEIKIADFDTAMPMNKLKFYMNMAEDRICSDFEELKQVTYPDLTKIRIIAEANPPYRPPDSEKCSQSVVTSFMLPTAYDSYSLGVAMLGVRTGVNKINALAQEHHDPAQLNQHLITTATKEYQGKDHAPVIAKLLDPSMLVRGKYWEEIYVKRDFGSIHPVKRGNNRLVRKKKFFM